MRISQTFICLVLVLVISCICQQITLWIPFYAIHWSFTRNLMHRPSSLNIRLTRQRSKIRCWIYMFNKLLYVAGVQIYTISIKGSSLADAIYSPVWLKLIVLTGHLEKIRVINNKSRHVKLWIFQKVDRRNVEGTWFYSNLVNVLTQSISDTSQRLTSESALPTAKYLKHVKRNSKSTLKSYSTQSLNYCNQVNQLTFRWDLLQYNNNQLYGL